MDQFYVVEVQGSLLLLNKEAHRTLSHSYHCIYVAW